MFLSARSAALIVIAVVIVPRLAFGQAVDAQPATGKPPAIHVGFDGGFFIESDDRDNRLTFGMVAQTDGRFSTDDPNPIVNTFTVRKFRPTFTGQIAKYFEFKVMPDFGSGKSVVQDAYFAIRFSPRFRVRIGKDKTPIGYELLQGDSYLLFPERSLASSLVPNRDIGVAVQGDLAETKVSYAIGVYNGIPDGTSISTELDTNGAKDLAGRVTVQPFRRTRNPGPLSGLGFQVGGSSGKESGDLPSFRTSAQQIYFAYGTTASASGSHTRISPAVFYYLKSVGTFAEYVRSTQAVARSTTTADVENRAWNITGSWLLTGETASYGMVRPKQDFDPENGHWGALQLLARYAVLTVDRDAFDLGFAALSASREARQLTVGANWYPTAFVKLYATYERTTFHDGAARPSEHVILFRSQLAFGDRR